MAASSGHNVKWYRTAQNSLQLEFDSPWYPPSGEVIAALSALFECEIRHTYREPVSSLCGYDCYDQGTHVDGHPGITEEVPAPGLYLISDETKDTETATEYARIRA